MRSLILACGAASLALACGSSSSPKDDTSGKTAPTQTNLTITTTGNGLVRGAGTDCRGSCRAQIAVGAPVHLVAVPDSGAFFVGWAGACSGSGACDLMLDVDRDVTATFGDRPPPPPPGKHQLVVVVQGKGRVTSSPAGIDCDSGTCSSAFDSGASVTLTAVPAAGFTFSGWGTDCNGPGACTLSLSKDATVFASFVAAPPPPPPARVHLTASVSGSGTVSGGGLSCGESASTCDVMLDAGTTVTLTASAAGGTRFMGWGGACSGTLNPCQLTLQADTNVTAAFQSEVIALAPNDTTNGVVIALNSTRVFWQRFVNGVDEIWSIPKDGGKAVRVAGGVANAMVADDDFLYWTDNSNVYSTPVAGGQVALLANGSPIGKLALDELGALYWTVGPGPNEDTNGGSLHRMENRADSIILRGGGPNNMAIGVDGTHVYFTAFNGLIKRAPRTGGAAGTVISCGNCFLNALKVDPQFVYYRAFYSGPSGCDSQSGRIEALRKSDLTSRVVSSQSTANCAAMDIDANGSVVYWNAISGPGPFGIFRVNADGTGQQAVDSGNDRNWMGVRVDDGAVYYWHNGAIIRRLK